MSIRMLSLLFSGLVASVAVLAAGQAPATPRAALDALLEADRAFATAARTDAAKALGDLLADDATVLLPRGVVARDAATARAAYADDPTLAGATAQWEPAWAGIAADGRHGFTAGFITLTGADGKTTPQKYLAYWVRGDDGWRAAVYRRRARAAGDADATLVPLVPAVASTTVRGQRAATEKAVAAAEQAFSDDAQVMGLGPAFVKYAAPVAINLGGPDDAGFVVGGEAIAKAVAAGEPATGGSSVSWSADRVIAADSGDLAVTIGAVRLDEKPADPAAPSAFPFFTIWHRADADAPWRYVAE